MVILLNLVPLALILLGGYLGYLRKWKSVAVATLVLVVYTVAQPSYVPKGVVERTYLPPMEQSKHSEIRNNLRSPVNGVERDKAMKEKLQDGVKFLINDNDKEEE